MRRLCRAAVVFVIVANQSIVAASQIRAGFRLGAGHRRGARPEFRPDAHEQGDQKQKQDRVGGH